MTPQRQKQVLAVLHAQIGINAHEAVFGGGQGACGQPWVSKGPGGANGEGCRNGATIGQGDLGWGDFDDLTAQLGRDAQLFHRGDQISGGTTVEYHPGFGEVAGFEHGSVDTGLDPTGSDDQIDPITTIHTVRAIRSFGASCFDGVVR